MFFFSLTILQRPVLSMNEKLLRYCTKSEKINFVEPIPWFGSLGKTLWIVCRQSDVITTFDWKKLREHIKVFFSLFPEDATYGSMYYPFIAISNSQYKMRDRKKRR